MYSRINSISSKINECCEEIHEQNNIINTELLIIKKCLTLVLVTNKQIQIDIKKSFKTIKESENE